jgi:pimeloyl-ACP methyl ester carboxylesterase
VSVGPPTTISTPDGRSLDVWLEGPPDGIPLVYHLGTPCAGLPYQPFVDAVAARGLRWVSFSRPGYGSSTRKPGRRVADVVADTAVVLDSIGAERAYLAGWSGGGPHALACAALMPDRVIAAATVAGVAPYPAEGLDWLAGMGEENVEEFGAALEGPEALIAFKEKAWPTYRNITADEVAAALGDLVDEVDRAGATGPVAAYLAALFREALREGYWGWFDDDMAFTKPWGFDLASIRRPVHVWQGAHDRMVPYGHGEWLAAHVGGACAHLHAEHGHITLAVDSIAEIVDALISGT